MILGYFNSVAYLSVALISAIALLNLSLRQRDRLLSNEMG